ncbi:MAG: hypothetical protein M3R04_08490 [bacterium]|nr:hypothetical protein [bacterium]
MSITKNAMVLNIAIGLWQGYRLDKEASSKVTRDANANSDAARVNKHLVPKEALKPIVSAAGALRAHFYSKTLPWKDNGDRLITRLMYLDFIPEHERLVAEFNDAVEEFLTTSYPAAREQAEFRMGELFNASDYPTSRELRHRFYVEMDIDAVTESGDFRVEMDADQVNAVRSSMEEAMRGRIGRAMQDVWSRLGEVVGHFAEKMGSDGIFRDTTVRNLEELVDLLPGLNVLDDPDLKRIGDDIKARLTGYEPKDLRKDDGARSQAAKDAADIMEQMAGFMNAFNVQGDA